MTLSLVNTELKSIARMHTQLEVTVDRLREWMEEVTVLGIARFGELGDRLRFLYDQLDEQFQAEEDGGYLSDASSVAPYLANEAIDLLMQHAQLLEQLETIICRSSARAPEFTSWQQARFVVNDFLSQLDQHKQRELAILKTADAHEASSR